MGSRIRSMTILVALAGLITPVVAAPRDLDVRG
jgi:hypothetical protein